MPSRVSWAKTGEVSSKWCSQSHGSEADDVEGAAPVPLRNAELRGDVFELRHRTPCAPNVLRLSCQRLLARSELSDVL